MGLASVSPGLRLALALALAYRRSFDWSLGQSVFSDGISAVLRFSAVSHGEMYIRFSVSRQPANLHPHVSGSCDDPSSSAAKELCMRTLKRCPTKDWPGVLRSASIRTVVDGMFSAAVSNSRRDVRQKITRGSCRTIGHRNLYLAHVLIHQPTESNVRQQVIPGP